ncbi:hypothetical protein HanIR_Chr04g0192281 [Helianthus annuus]|nr:hypothetical protein HanIR_Chr04g0192281 [Helianthus annuus]
MISNGLRFDYYFIFSILLRFVVWCETLLHSFTLGSIGFPFTICSLLLLSLK